MTQKFTIIYWEEMSWSQKRNYFWMNIEMKKCREKENPKPEEHTITKNVQDSGSYKSIWLFVELCLCVLVRERESVCACKSFANGYSNASWYMHRAWILIQIKLLTLAFATSYDFLPQYSVAVVYLWCFFLLLLLLISFVCECVCARIQPKQISEQNNRNKHCTKVYIYIYEA